MKNIYKALANFQQECPTILKDTQGYGYTYADLPDIYKVIMPLLKSNGLGFTQILKDKGLETTLFHIESGEVITGYVEIPTNVSLAKMNEYQVMGSAYTYYRRYALSSMLGIVTDKDTDATGEKTKDLVDTEIRVYNRMITNQPPASYPVRTYQQAQAQAEKKVAKEPVDNRKEQIVSLCKQLGIEGEDYKMFVFTTVGRVLKDPNFDEIIVALQDKLKERYNNNREIN